MSQAQHQSTSSAPAQPANRGPIGMLLAAALNLIFAVVMAWLLGIVVEIVGMYFLWPQQGIHHSEAMAQETIAHIATYPKSVLVPDTVKFAHDVSDWVVKPFIAIGALKFIRANSGAVADGLSRTKRALTLFLRELARFALIAIYVAQNLALRLSIVVFALPLFALLSLFAIVDGLVRRDLRKWNGGRESSFVYHHAKKLTQWGLTGGLALYLAWPLGGMNPIYAVTALCAFAAWTLSLTVASFKKYL